MIASSVRLFARAFVLLLLWSPLSAQIRVVDDLDRTVTLSHPAERVVSLAPSITETLFAIDAGTQVVGVTDYCNFPAEARTKPRVGGVINPAIETIVGLKPDLVIMTVEGNDRRDFDKLQELGLTVFVTNPRSLEGILASIEDVGALTGRADTAHRLVQRLRARARQIAERVAGLPKPSVLMIVSVQPLIVVGRGNFIAEVLERAGGRNAALSAVSSFPVYSREAVLKDDPDMFIFTCAVLPDSTELVQLFPEWSNLKAVRRGAVFHIDADIISRPGPRIVEALEILYRILHTNSPSQGTKQ